MPSTSSLNVTSICCNDRTVAPGAGNRVAIAGGVLSTSSYCQDDPGALADALVRVLSDRVLAERLATGARDAAAPWLQTPEEYARRMRELVV